MDDSDTEWEEHVKTHYGGRGYNRGVDNSVPMDMDLDIDGLVWDVVQNYEDIREAVWANSQTCQNVGEEVSDAQRDVEDAATIDENENVQDMPGEDEQHQQPQVQLDFDTLNDAYKTPLYSGTRLSCLAAVPLLLNLCRTHGCSELMMDEMLMLIKRSILLELNSLPETTYEANKYLKRLGLGFNVIHVCPNSSMLFRGTYSKLKACLKCGASRFQPSRSNGVPQKVMWHFPLIPRLKRMFSTPELAKLMRWQPQHKSKDNKIRYVVDSD
jgi:hypothetical protein